MARNFAAGTDLVSIANDAAYDLALLSFSAKIRQTDATNLNTIAGRADTIASFSGFSFVLNGGPPNLFLKDGTGIVLNVIGTTDAADGAWHTVGFVARQASGGTGRVYVDGVDEASGANSAAWTFNGQALRLGLHQDAFWSPFVGDIAEVAIWDVELDANEFAALHKGFTPDRIRPSSLVSYWPLIGKAATELDIVGGRGGTVTGTTAAAHPRVIQSPRMYYSFIPAVVAGGGGSADNLLTLLGVGS